MSILFKVNASLQIFVFLSQPDLPFARLLYLLLLHKLQPFELTIPVVIESLYLARQHYLTMHLLHLQVLVARLFVFVRGSARFCIVAVKIIVVERLSLESDFEIVWSDYQAVEIFDGE